MMFVGPKKKFKHSSWELWISLNTFWLLSKHWKLISNTDFEFFSWFLVRFTYSFIKYLLTKSQLFFLR